MYACMNWKHVQDETCSNKSQQKLLFGAVHSIVVVVVVVVDLKHININDKSLSCRVRLHNTSF